MIEEIKSYNDYKIRLIRLIKMGEINVLENFISGYIEYKEILIGDEKMKEKCINKVLCMNNRELCEIILDLFDIEEEIPECDRLSDIIYISDMRYRSNLVNKEMNICYIFDLHNLEGFDNNISIEDFYYASGDKKYFNKIKIIMEERLSRGLKGDELEYILEKSGEYRDYINNEYNNIIEDIIEEEGYMESNMECYNILYNYLGKRPNNFEVKLLMKMSV
jgi:hypothetical protein